MADPPGDYGYIKISRKAYASDPFWNERREFSRWEAWEYLIQEAGFADRKWTDGSTIIELERGETRPLSLRYLAGEWGWTVKKVRVFLDLIQKDGRIRAQQQTAQGHTFTLVNYDVYQGEGHSKGTARGTPRAQQGHNKKKGKKGKKSTEESSPRESRLPDDWAPTAEHIKRARRSGIDLMREVESFRAHAEENDRKAKVWNGAFTRWLINAEKYAKKNGTQSSARKAGLPGTSQRMKNGGYYVGG